MNKTVPKGLTPWALVAIVIFVTVLAVTHGSAKSAPAAAPAGQAHLVMRRSKSASYCVEGSGPGTHLHHDRDQQHRRRGRDRPAVGDLRLLGRRHSQETYMTGSASGGEFTVPAHSVRVARFVHSYDPQQHALIRCAGYLDLNDTTSRGYYLYSERG